MKAILLVAGTWITQDSIASLWFYWGREGNSHQAFRWVRLGMGLMLLVAGLL